MKAVKLAGLEPASVMGFFEKLCSMPHGSFNCQQISDYLVSFAKERNLRYVQDQALNVVIYKAGSKGYENQPPLILQAHMDMVCEQDPDCQIDMTTAPLDITHDGEKIWANHTSLGADDCIGVAYCLAILDDDSIVHPPLEVVLTADEEPGMVGISQFDFSLLSAKRMINLDTQSEGRFTVGCAGAVCVNMEAALTRTAYTGTYYQLTAEGFRGGHSSAVNWFPANCNKIMGQLLERVGKLGDFRLADIHGGNKPNAIPRETVAVIAGDALTLETLQAVCRELEEEIHQTYKEPNSRITAQTVDYAGGVMSKADTQRIISLIRELPNGVQSWVQGMKNTVQTSLNLGCISTEDKIFLTSHMRSSVNREKCELREKVEGIAAKYGFQTEAVGDSGAWEYREQSQLRQTMCRVFEQTLGYEPVVQTIHAALECGNFYDNIPDLDCVSTGTTADFIHTNREVLNIASVGRVWDFLLKLLKEL